MQTEQRVPDQSIENIMKDPKKYRKMMMIIEQTLYDLGYTQSAKMLQNQSGVSYYTNELLSIRQHLEKNDYQSAIQVIDSLNSLNSLEKQNQTISHLIQQNHNNQSPLNNHKSQLNHGHKNSITKLSHSSLSQTKNMIYQTYCMQKILDQEYDQAMKIISDNIENQSKKQSLCQALVLGNHHVTHQFIEKKKEEIFKFCLSEYQDIGEREIEKVIESYTQHQGQHNKQLKSLLSGSTKKLPPIKLLTSEFQQSIRNSITHMKLNQTTNQLIIVDQGKDFQQIFYLSFNKQNYEYQRQMSHSGHLSLKLKYPVFSPIFNREVSFTYKNKRQSIEAVAFSHNKDNPMVAVASYSIVQLFDWKLDVMANIEAHNKIEKFIHVQFNPISDLLYNCGYFQSMQIMDSTGIQLMSIYPYPKTRKFIFYKSQIIGISLVTNKIYKHSIDEQVLTKERQLDELAIPMDLCINEKQDRLAVSSLQFLYVIDAESLEILGKTTSPANPNKAIVETKFYGQFLVTLCKSFTAYEFKQDRTIQSTNNGQTQRHTQKNLLISKVKEWSGEGTFDICSEMMISGLKEICCWEEADAEYLMMDEESEFEEEIDGDGGHLMMMRDIGNQEDEEEEIDSEIDSNQLEDQSESMEEQEDDDDEDQLAR